jgi:fatty acid synthase subunit alpha, fungi type
MGGMQSLRRVFRDRTCEADMPSDALQETFINTAPAWVNMLFLSASGPILTPVGACATAAESLALAVDTIRAGKASGGSMIGNWIMSTGRFCHARLYPGRCSNDR